MAQTLHGGSTCPGNGKVVTVDTGNRTVSLATAGTGAVRFSAQLWRRESGCAPGQAFGQSHRVHWTLNVSNPARLLGLRGYIQQ